jgi:uncharacterized repeat protein (TIGR03803 family)
MHHDKTPGRKEPMKTTNILRALACHAGLTMTAALASTAVQAQVAGSGLVHGPAYKTTAAFDQADGRGPASQLLQAGDGRFYGTTQYGGAYGQGALFQVDPATGRTRLLHSFIQDDTDGFQPVGNLVDGGDGYIYGTTSLGGAYFDGTVYRFSRDGRYQVLHAFQGGASDGMLSGSGLVVGRDGDLYGTTAFGGASGQGVVFRMTRAGVVTLLHSFSGADGQQPQWGLTAGHDGALYGTTNRGGVNDAGTAFRITPSGAFTTLHSMSPGIEGVYPSRLILARNGLFYGTTPNGGPSTGGTIFSMTPAGTVTVLHAFTQGTAGGDSPSWLMQADDGNLWGVTENFGSDQVGTLFRMSTSGAFATIHAFAAASGDGALPLAPPVQACNGVLYGMTSLGGIAGQPGYGTIYQVTKR